MTARLTELYRLEADNGRPLCVVNAQTSPWGRPKLELAWLRFVVATSLRLWLIGRT